MVDNPPPGLTARAAAELVLFLDEATRLDRQCLLAQAGDHQIAVGFTAAEWTEILAAFRDSMRVEEGITGGDATAKEIGGG